ncbi:MAG: hypothetical protein AAGU27_19795 [Dehalobacterium sp.]
MKRIDDFFAAGVIIGSISNLFNTTASLLYLALDLNLRMPWDDMALLFFRGPSHQTFWAQLLGFFITFGVASTNGIIVGAVYKFTGRDFPYLKSIVVCISSVSFAFMVLYPTLGLKLEQYNVGTTYSALLNNIPFATIMAYLFIRFTNIGTNKTKSSKIESSIIHKKHRFIQAPQLKPKQEEKGKDKKISFIKPKKLK